MKDNTKTIEELWHLLSDARFKALEAALKFQRFLDNPNEIDPTGAFIDLVSAADFMDDARRMIEKAFPDEMLAAAAPTLVSVQ